MLRFVIYDVDIFGDANFIGQYTVPVRCIRHGYRSIPLKNAYSEDLELAGKNHSLSYSSDVFTKKPIPNSEFTRIFSALFAYLLMLFFRQNTLI